MNKMFKNQIFMYDMHKTLILKIRQIKIINLQIFKMTTLPNKILKIKQMSKTIKLSQAMKLI